jgi:geranyl diphosphate synthase
MYSMEYYLQKTYYKTASLISNSCKVVAILAGHTADVSVLAYEYGRNLVNYLALSLILKIDSFQASHIKFINSTNLECLQGLAFQLIDDVLDFTGTSASLGKGSLTDIRHVITCISQLS